MSRLRSSLRQLLVSSSAAKAAKQAALTAVRRRALGFEALEDRRVMAITPIALSDFTSPRVQDFQAVSTGPIAANAAAFQAIGISSITGTSDTDVDSYSTGSPAASRSLAATSTGLRVIDPNSGDANDKYGNNNSYTINFAQPQTRFGFTNDDSGGSGFTFNIVLFSGATQVDSGSLAAPIFGQNPLYFSSTVAFDRVVISNGLGDGFVIDNLTTETPAPTITAPTFINVTEDQASALTGISFTTGTGSATATFSVPSGTLTATSGSVTVVGSGTGTLTLSGTAANVNTFISGSNLKFQTALNQTSSVTLSIGINDNATVAQTASTTVALNVNPVNDNPVNTLPTLLTNEDTPLDVTGFSITDVDSTGPFSVNVRLNNPAAGILTLRTDVAGGLVGSGINNNILNNGTANLTIIGATLAAINTTLSAPHGLVYTPANNFNGLALFAVDTNSDGNGGSDVGDTSIFTVSAVNDAPVNTVPSNLIIQTDVLTPITGISISDVDAGGANVQVTLSVTNGTLTVRDDVVGGLTSGNLTNNGTATVTITAPQATINATFVDALGIRYLSNLAYSGPETLTVTTSDLGNVGSGGAQTDIDPISIQISPPNQAPTITAPASFLATQGLPSPLTGISFADADAGSALVTAIFDVATGTLTATSGGGVTALGSGTGTLSLSGSIANINAFITGSNLLFTKSTLGPITLSIGINDNGNTGIGGPLSANTTKTINLVTVPTISVDDVIVSESAGVATFKVSLSNASGVATTFTYGTASNSAVSGQDFTASSGTLTIPAGDTQTTFTVSITNDVLVEPTETFFVNLSNVSNATIADGQGEGTILDNDVPPTLISPTATNIALTTATLGGNVVASGSASIIERGIVYSITALNGNPQLGGTAVVQLTAPGTTGTFTIDVSALPTGTQFSYAAYATNTVGTTYTTIGTFTTQPAIGQLPGITVQVLGNVMTITGTAQDDTIKVASDGMGGLIVSSNQPINGLASPQTFTGATSFVANTLGGNDDVWLAAPLTFDSVAIDLAAGNDRVVLGADPNNAINNNVLDPQFGTLGYLTVNGPVTVIGGEGNDRVIERSTEINGIKTISLGEGNNEYNVYWGFSNETNFSSGAGQDNVYIGYLSSRQASQFDTGAGNDLISYYASRFYKTAYLNTGTGADTVALDVNIYDDATTVDTGSEADYLLFSRSVAYSSVTLTTSAGADYVLIGKYISGLSSSGGAVYSNGGSNIDQLTLNTGAEVDSVQIAANVMRLFYANLGDAYDDADVSYNLFTDGLLDGGGQSTRLKLTGNKNLRTRNPG